MVATPNSLTEEPRMNIHKNARTTGRVSVLLRSRSHDLTNVALRAGCGLSEQRYAGRVSDLSTRLCLARSVPLVAGGGCRPGRRR